MDPAAVGLDDPLERLHAVCYAYLNFARNAHTTSQIATAAVAVSFSGSSAVTSRRSVDSTRRCWNWPLPHSRYAFTWGTKFGSVYCPTVRSPCCRAGWFRSTYGTGQPRNLNSTARCSRPRANSSYSSAASRTDVVELPKRVSGEQVEAGSKPPMNFKTHSPASAQSTRGGPSETVGAKTVPESPVWPVKALHNLTTRGS